MSGRGREALQGFGVLIWILAGIAGLIFGMCAQPGERLQHFRWSGWVEDGGSSGLRPGQKCSLDITMTHEQKEWEFVLVCGRERLAQALRGVASDRRRHYECKLSQETVAFEGHRYDLRCISDDEQVVIDTARGAAELRSRDGREVRVAFERMIASRSGEPSFHTRPFFSWPGSPREWWLWFVRWGAPLVWVLGALGLWGVLYARWTAEKRRRQRAHAAAMLEGMPELGQVAVRVRAWPPAGALEAVERTIWATHLLLPSARWPRGAPVRLVPGARIDRRGTHDAEVAWIAGLRRGGDGAGATHRTMEARLDPLPDGAYLVAPWPLRFTHLHGWDGPRMPAPPVLVSHRWGWRLLWAAVAVGPVLGPTGIGFASVAVLAGLGVLALSFRKR